jgi:hypothetical protein
MVKKLVTRKRIESEIKYIKRASIHKIEKGDLCSYKNCPLLALGEFMGIHVCARHFGWCWFEQDEKDYIRKYGNDNE